MSTVAEIKEAISQLPHDEQFGLGLWLAKALDLRLYTDDGLDVEKVRKQIADAEKGEYHTVNPKEEIARLMATLDEGFIDQSPENIARIQRKLDEVDPSKARPWTNEDWQRLHDSMK